MEREIEGRCLSCACGCQWTSSLLNPDSDGPEQEGEGEGFFNVKEVLGRPIGEDDNAAGPNIADIQHPRFKDAEEELEEED